MSWFALIAALLKAASSLSSYLQQRQLITAAQAEVLQKNMEAALGTINDAKKARAAAAAKFDAAGGVPDETDPNLRD